MQPETSALHHEWAVMNGVQASPLPPPPGFLMLGVSLCYLSAWAPAMSRELYLLEQHPRS